jgi:hypothetical protein
MIKLTDFLQACKVPLDLHSYKIHLATGFPNPPLEAFFQGKFKEWQEWQTRRNFPRKQVIGLIALPERNRWLFAGVYKVVGIRSVSNDHVEYDTELLLGQDDLIGRIVVEYDRQARQPYLNGPIDGGKYFISEIREKKLTIQEFPGYDSVCISYSELKIIIEQNISSWRGALANIKGIYLIADRKNGKHYVGCATGDAGIWQRWSSYAATGHGGNKELVDLLASLPSDYASNFQYSILEIADFHTSDQTIFHRESYWKNILLSRIYGYNSN